MGKAPCCSKVGLLKGPWSNKEDTLLTTYIQANGEGKWKSLPKNAGLLRCGKSCRLRWINYLRPGIKRGNISSDEDDLIIRLHSLLGNRWSLIAARLPGRTDNEIKNYWNTHLIKKLKSSGLQQMRANKTASKRLPKESKKNLARADYEKTNGYKKKKQDIKKSSINDGPNSIEVVDKIKIYVPKPIRFCSVFSNNNTENSAIVTRASPSYWEVNKEAKVVDDDMLHFDWPICEQVCEDDQVLGQGCDFLFKDSISTMFNMQAMDKAYEEFLQSL